MTAFCFFFFFFNVKDLLLHHYKKTKQKKQIIQKLTKKQLLGCKCSEGKHTESLKKGCAVLQSGGQNIIEHMESG